MPILRRLSLRSLPERLEELASALDAGLRAETAAHAAGIDANVGDGLVEAMRRSGFGLAAHELELLAACERAGRLPAALRRMAAIQVRRRDRQRRLVGRLAYPSLILGFGVVLALAIVPAGRVTGIVTLTLTIGLLLGIVGVAWRVRAAQRDPAIDPARWPLVGAIARDAAESPYLAAMHALHGSGVPLDEAHRLATKTVPYAAARARLIVAAEALRRGLPLAESLATCASLSPESLEILARAEPLGALEDAFTRAATRRDDTLDRRLDTAVRVLGSVAFAAAAILVLVIALDFYGGLFARVLPR